MPPPVEEMSDEESGDIPFSTANNAPQNNGDEKQEDQEGEEDEGEEDEEEEEGLYVVENILTHDFQPNGDIFLQVKWKGYEDPEDLTWEPEENLKDGANDVLEEYYKKTGGRPKKPTAKPGPKPGLGRKRKSTGDSKSVTPSATDVTEPKRRRKSAKAEETPVETDLEMDDWVPKSNNWEKELQSVDTIIRDPENNGLYAFILWKNGKRSRVSIESCYEKCPRKMLKFYESHLVFKEG